MSIGEDLFDLWAPPESPWSVWAKPVLFAGIDNPLDATVPLEIPVVTNFPRPAGKAVVVDVPGSDAVLCGLALARAGYRPVPLFNGSVAPNMLVDMRIIANYLGFGARTLRACSLKADAPPAFLLNADRLDNAAGATKPGRYDNRWCVVPQDMPSAGYLMGEGIKQIIVVSDKVRDDLSHVLCRYQDAGIAILRAPDLATAPMPVTVSKPAFYRSLLYRLQAFSGLRRNSVGGFGAIVPNPSSGGFAG